MNAAHCIELKISMSNLYFALSRPPKNQNNKIEIMRGIDGCIQPLRVRHRSKIRLGILDKTIGYGVEGIVFTGCQPIHPGKGQ